MQTQPKYCHKTLVNLNTLHSSSSSLSTQAKRGLSGACTRLLLLPGEKKEEKEEVREGTFAGWGCTWQPVARCLLILRLLVSVRYV